MKITILASLFILTFASAFSQYLVNDGPGDPPKKNMTMDQIRSMSRKQRALSQIESKNTAYLSGQYRTPYKAYGDYEFDRYKSNVDRFKNSPCYNKLGFDPIQAMTDSIGLEREYQTCEKEFKNQRNEKILYIFLSIIILLLIGILIYKKTKK